MLSVARGENKLGGLPLHSKFGIFEFYWSGTGNDFILSRGNGLMVGSRSKDGISSLTLSERGKLVFERRSDSAGESSGCSSYVYNKNGDVVGVFEDSDGDGVFDYFMDFIKKKKFSLFMKD